MVQGAAMYLQERVDALRKDIDRHGKVKVKKGQKPMPASEVGSHLLSLIKLLPDGALAPNLAVTISLAAPLLFPSLVLRLLLLLSFMSLFTYLALSL